MDPILEPRSPAPAGPRVGRRGAIVAALFGSLLLGGVVAATQLGGADVTLAASSTASPSPSASTAPATGGSWGERGQGPGGWCGGSHEAVSDTSVAAKAIGISESDLLAALAKGQTIAQVAKAHGVEVQKVIDALVVDADDELATAVKNGQLTQAQADAEKAQVTQRVTDQVNGRFPGPGGTSH